MALSVRIVNGMRFWRVHGTRMFVWEVWRRLRRTPPQPPGPPLGLAPAPAPPPPPPTPPAALLPLAREVVRTRLTALDPLPAVIATAPARTRVTMITDGIDTGRLFGGVGTAMILAALLARARGAQLRLITRNERAKADNLDAVLSLYGIRPEGDVEFVFAPPGSRRGVPVLDDELVLTTSWWTTAATLGGVRAQQILYLLQEDERMFYPLGDDHLLCSRVLSDTRLRLAINTPLLMQHLGSTGVPGLAERAVAFEPAFPGHIFRRRDRPAGAKRLLLFYARPTHLRNLFHFGLDVLDQAVRCGAIDLSRWDIAMVGAQIPPFRFDNGYIPERHEGLSWQAYAELVGRADLGLSLMYTPHPSYPPLDLAASGAVVVTNRYGIKTDLARYSENILCADLEPAALVQALRDGIQLAENESERARRFAAQSIADDWAKTLQPVIDRFA